MTRRTRCATTALIIVAGLAGCSDPPSRAGGDLEPATLRSGYGLGAGGVGPDVLDALVRRTSGAAVAVTTPVPGRDVDDEDGSAVPRLRSGEFDIAVLRADALATAGATSLAVLQTPLLVTSEDQAAAVAADPVADELMAGLSDIDLVGLALVPGGLRHPFGYGHSLLVPDDYAEAPLNARPGDGSRALASALGTTLDTSRGHARTLKVQSHRLTGIETSLQQFGAVDRPATLTSNVTLYTKFDVVVARAAAWERLSEGQRDALRSAVRTAVDETLASRDTEAEGLDRWCSTPGATSVVAGASDVAAVTKALRPLAEAATDDPVTAPLVRRITELGEGTTPAPGRVCGEPDRSSDVVFGLERTGDQSVFDGVWRVEAREEDFLAAGQSLGDASVNAGVWTITVDGHVAEVDQPTGPDCTWDFAVAGNRVLIDFGARGNDACYGVVIGTWHRHGDVVTFDLENERDYDVALDRAFFAHGMHLIR